MGQHEIETAADHWDQYWTEGREHRSLWLSHPLIQEYLNELRGGQALDDWLIRTVLPDGPVGRGLGIGSGSSMLELLLVQRGIVETYDLYDISQASLDIARETAHRFGVANRVRFHCQDVYQAEIPQNAYDLVTFMSSLHHMHDLDAILGRVYAALTRDGVLFADEYIGPNRFTFPPEHLTFARDLFGLLDRSLKGPGAELPMPTLEAMMATDPTEAVHSAEILQVISDHFPHVAVTPMQNTLPFIIWPGLNADALFDTVQGEALVRVLIAADNALIATGRLPNYFVLIAARK